MELSSISVDLIERNVTTTKKKAMMYNLFDHAVKLSRNKNDNIKCLRIKKLAGHLNGKYLFMCSNSAHFIGII